MSRRRSEINPVFFARASDVAMPLVYILMPLPRTLRDAFMDLGRFTRMKPALLAQPISSPRIIVGQYRSFALF